MDDKVTKEDIERLVGHKLRPTDEEGAYIFGREKSAVNTLPKLNHLKKRIEKLEKKSNLKEDREVITQLVEKLKLTTKEKDLLKTLRFSKWIPSNQLRKGSGTKNYKSLNQLISRTRKITKRLGVDIVSEKKQPYRYKLSYTSQKS